MKIRDKIKNKIIRLWFELAQMSVEEIDDGLTSSPETVALCRKLAAEGCVLVKNDEVLPINKEETVALFGRCQENYFYVGYGSGGDVKPPYRISPIEAFDEASVSYDKALYEIYRNWIIKNPPDDGAWGNWPMCYDEMPLDEQVVSSVAQRNDKAIVFIGRSSGEDRETKREPGSYYLTENEEQMLALVTKHFSKVCVVLNCGSVFDVSWIEKYKVDAVLFAWQGGQESGRALVDILTGVVNPSGKLTDTIAPIEKYPSTDNFGDKKLAVYTEDIYVGYRYFETFDKESVIYPFGYGLSYSKFDIKGELISSSGTKVKIKTLVKNTGDVSGKEVVQIYMKAPQGKLGKAERELIYFVKTKDIEPGKSAQNTFEVDLSEFASYDDTGVTGNLNSYILEAGNYELYVGADVRSATCFGVVELEEVLVKKTLEVLPPDRGFDRLVNKSGRKCYLPVEAGKRNLKERVLKRVPLPMRMIKGQEYTIDDVKTGVISLDDFVASLSIEELETLSRGSLECMNSSWGPVGNAAVFGGTTKSLEVKGVPAVSTNDGPSGCRLQAHSTLFPIGAVLASSFDPELISEMVACLGKEVIERKSHVLLAPGLNIHRNPLCGRNFEYFSEDPYVSGVIACAYVDGVQSVGCSAVPKHVCCNNQETGRNICNSVVSQRALREIYLRGFERCIKYSKPDFLMTSYNKINGVYSYYSFDLCTVLLRDEFGFEGLIMTDWWIKDGVLPEFPQVNNQALRVRAGNNLYMPGAPLTGKYKHQSDGSIERSLKADEGLSLGELQRNAKQVLEYCMRKG